VPAGVSRVLSTCRAEGVSALLRSRAMAAKIGHGADGRGRLARIRRVSRRQGLIGALRGFKFHDLFFDRFCAEAPIRTNLKSGNAATLQQSVDRQRMHVQKFCDLVQSHHRCHIDAPPHALISVR
jgi:hypothetical protein